jgi:hypothetical protein
MDWVGKAWRGEERCWIAYWVYGFVFSIGWSILLSLAAVVPLALIPLGLLYLCYIIWVLVSQWRCAFNLEWRFWGYVVRFLIIMIPVLFIGGIFVGGVTKGNQLIHAAQCKAAMKDPAWRSAHPGVYERCLSEAAGKR